MRLTSPFSPFIGGSDSERIDATVQSALFAKQILVSGKGLDSRSYPLPTVPSPKCGVCVVVLETSGGKAFCALFFE